MIEGIMMVGPEKSTAAFCDENGSITTEEITYTPILKAHPILGKPFIRGTFSMVDSLRRGYKALSIAADKFVGEEEEPQSGFGKWLTDRFGDKITNAIMLLASVLGVGLAMLLFFVLPTVLFNLLSGAVSANIAPLRAIFEGFLRFLLFLAYMVAVSFVPDIHRTFMYHGAEHKTISCYEQNLPLTVENVRKQTRFHPRCGTSFMILMLLISIFIGFFIPFTHPITRSLTKILTIPLVMNIGYELLRLCGRHDNLLTRIIATPGLWMQRLTTKEPEDKMMEAAIIAMEAVIPANGEDLVLQ